MKLKDDALVLLGLSCPYCGAPTRLVDDAEIYGKSYGSKCYVCKPCGAWVGCHKGTDNALGRLADKELRELKHQAHEAFDRLWKNGHMPRKAAYEILSKSLGLPLEQTHIGMFNGELCKKTANLSVAIINFIKSAPKGNTYGKTNPV